MLQCCDIGYSCLDKISCPVGLQQKPTVISILLLFKLGLLKFQLNKILNLLLDDVSLQWYSA